MAASKDFPLSLTIKAVDKATEPLRRINARIQKLTEPARKLNNSFRALAAEAGLPKLGKGLAGFGKAVKNVGGEALALGAKLAAMAAGAGFALYSIVRGAVDAGDKLGEMSQRVGLSADAYAQLQYAAAQADVEQEQFNASMDQFNKRLGEAKYGKGELVGLLKMIGPNASTEQALAKVVDVLERVRDPAKRAALAAAAFGKSGLAMGQFLGQGSAKIAEARRRFFELAGSQQQFVDGAGSLDNALRDTETAFLGLRSAAAAELFPALTELAKGLSDVLAGERGNLREWARETGKELLAWVKGGGLRDLVTGVRDLATSAKELSTSLGGLKGVAAITGGVMAGPLLMSILSLAGATKTLALAAFPVLVRAAMLLAPAIGSVGSAIFAATGVVAPLTAAVLGLAAGGYAVWKEWDNLKTLFTDFTKPGGLLLTLKEMLFDIRGLMPDKFGGTALKWLGKNLGITGGAPTGAANAAPPVPAAAGQASVKIDIGNLPPGSRVTQQQSTAELDLSYGYSLAP